MRLFLNLPLIILAILLFCVGPALAQSDVLAEASGDAIRVSWTFTGHTDTTVYRIYAQDISDVSDIRYGPWSVVGRKSVDLTGLPTRVHYQVSVYRWDAVAGEEDYLGHDVVAYGWDYDITPDDVASAVVSRLEELGYLGQADLVYQFDLPWGQDGSGMTWWSALRLANHNPARMDVLVEMLLPDGPRTITMNLNPYEISTWQPPSLVSDEPPSSLSIVVTAPRGVSAIAWSGHDGGGLCVQSSSAYTE